MTRARLTCRELIEFLDRYVEMELLPGERARFDAHLAVCTACVDYLHGYRQTRRLTSLLAEDAPAPDDVPVRLIAAILDARGRSA
jgi:anti-sigma factor RsiW